MTLYELFKTLHIIFAAIWVGTAAQQQFAASLAQKRAKTDPARLVEFADDAEFYGKRLFAPASGLTAVFGVAMVLLDGYPGFTETWVLIGIAIFVISSVIGAGFLTPESGRLKDLVQQKGLEDPEVKSRIARINMVVRIDFLLLILVIADMVIKPGL